MTKLQTNNLSRNCQLYKFILLSGYKMTASSETMCDKPQREFPNKLPGPEYKMEIYWVHAIPLVLGHFVGIYALWLVEKPLLSGIYGNLECLSFCFRLLKN